MILFSLILFGVFGMGHGSAAATINVDAAQAGDAIPDYHAWANLVERSYKGGGRGPADAQALKDLGIEYIRVFSVIECWAPYPHNHDIPSDAILNNIQNYDFNNSCFGPYGNDGLMDWIVNDVGAKPIISLHHYIPQYLMQYADPVDDTKNSCLQNKIGGCYPKDLRVLEILLKNAITHYKEKYGDKFKYFDVYNEPWIGGLTFEQYADFHLTAVKAVKWYNETYRPAVPVLVGGPGDNLAGLSSDPNSGFHYIEKVIEKLQATDSSLPHDFSTWHQYGAGYWISPNSVQKQMQQYDTFLRSRNVSTVQFAGEFGRTADNDSPSNIQDVSYGQNFCNAGPVQPTNTQVSSEASFTAAYFHATLDEATRLGIFFRPIYFSLEDYPSHRRSVLVPNRVRNKHTNQCEDGKVFPVYNVLSFWRDLSGLPRLAAASDDLSMQPNQNGYLNGTGYGVGAVASGDSDKIKILVYNQATTEGTGEFKDVFININNLPVGFRGKTVRITKYLTDATHGNYMNDPASDRAEVISNLGVSTTNSVTTNLRLDKNAVALVVLDSNYACIPQPEICGNGIDEDCVGADLSCPGGINLLTNGDFSANTNNWTFYTDGAGTFNVENGQGKVQITAPGTNVQLNQNNLSLEANTNYRLTFEAYSNTGHDLQARLIKDTSPFTSYGLSQPFDLGTSSSSHSVEFTTNDFTGNVFDARLYFWLADSDAAGDIYYFDNVKLEKVGETTPPAAPTGLIVQ